MSRRNSNSSNNSLTDKPPPSSIWERTMSQLSTEQATATSMLESSRSRSLCNSDFGDTDDDDDTDESDLGLAYSVTNEGSTGHEMVDRSLSMVDGNFSSKTSHHGDTSFICAPYKQEVFQQQLEENGPGSDRRNAIIGALQDLGVKVFIIDSISTPTTSDIIHHVKRVVGFIAKENRVLPHKVGGALGYQRCLLYQDHQGRLFNLLLSKYATGPANLYHEYLDSFSGLEAMLAITILSRSFACSVNLAEIDTFKPAYLSLILGLVLTEEISLSFLNSSMMVRASPSISAYTLTSPIGNDLLRQLIIFILALAGVTSGMTNKIMTLVGISGAVLVMLANLGARAWLFLRWQPQKYDGRGASFMAYLAAIGAGIVVPYLGHRNIEVGGKAALEYVIRTSFFVAVGFVISDLDAVKSFLVIGSEDCNQDVVNLVVGIWWFVTLFVGLIMVRKIKFFDRKPMNSEKLLEEDDASPAGYRVPSLPNFEIDPALARTGVGCFSKNFEFGFGILMAFVVGAGISYLAFTDWDDNAIDQIQEWMMP